MAPVSIVAKLTAAEGKIDELKAAIDDLVRLVESAEPGTLIYAAAQDNDDPDVIWFFEHYGSQEDAAAHSGGAALAGAGVAMRGLLAGRPEVHRLTPFSATGLPA